jgi:hypothetical protein
VGGQRFVAHNGAGGLMWGDVHGMALAAGKIYFARSNGTLYAVTFSSGVPNPATLSTIDSSPAQAWASRGMFVRNP